MKIRLRTAPHLVGGTPSLHLVAERPLITAAAQPLDLQLVQRSNGLGCVLSSPQAARSRRRSSSLKLLVAVAEVPALKLLVAVAEVPALKLLVAVAEAVALKLLVAVAEVLALKLLVAAAARCPRCPRRSSYLLEPTTATRVATECPYRAMGGLPPRGSPALPHYAEESRSAQPTYGRPPRGKQV